MGDASDMADVDRFLRSTEGHEFLEAFAAELRGRRIEEVTFSNEVLQVGIVLGLDDGNFVSMTRPELDLDALRGEFGQVLEREYLVDFPERGPQP